jgi:hypothetical protein
VSGAARTRVAPNGDVVSTWPVEVGPNIPPATRERPFDSLALVRMTGTRTDTLLFVRSVLDFGRRPFADPVPWNDDYTILRDGTLCVIRGRDLRVEWRAPDGVLLSEVRLPFPWQPMPDGVKQRVLDSLRAHYEAHPLRGDFSFTAPGVVRHYDAYVPDMMPLALMPDYAPVIHGYTASADEDSRVWVQVQLDGALPPSRWGAMLGPALRPAPLQPTYYVFNREGTVRELVRLPQGWQFAAAMGTQVYMIRERAGGRWELGVTPWQS